MARFQYLIAILLTVLSTNALAEWTLIGGTDDFDHYVDKSTISKTDNIAKMWELYDYKSPQKKNFGTYLSDVASEEYDCTESVSNMLTLTFYAKNMQQGEIVSRDRIDAKNWQYIVPGSRGETSLQIACSQ
jgi:hypothetical protein